MISFLVPRSVRVTMEPPPSGQLLETLGTTQCTPSGQLEKHGCHRAHAHFSKTWSHLVIRWKRKQEIGSRQISTCVPAAGWKQTQKVGLSHSLERERYPRCFRVTPSHPKNRQNLIKASLRPQFSTSVLYCADRFRTHTILAGLGQWLILA